MERPGGYPHHQLCNTEVERRLTQRGMPPDRARLYAWLRNTQPAIAAQVARLLAR